MGKMGEDGKSRTRSGKSETPTPPTAASAESYITYLSYLSFSDGRKENEKPVFILFSAKKKFDKGARKQRFKKRAARYPVLHFEKNAAPGHFKVLAAQLVEQGFPFKKAAYPPLPSILQTGE